MRMTSFRTQLFVQARLYSAFLITLIVPASASALTFSEVRETAALFLYGFIGLFGGITIAYFFSGWGLYISRRGTEHRDEGIFEMMMPAVKWMFAIMWLAILLSFIEK